MANRQLFFRSDARFPAADALNEAGGLAYRLSAEQALAQYAVSGCLNSTFYADAAVQLDTVLALCARVDPVFVAKTAVYARRHGQMKDLPALLTAWLAQHGQSQLPAVFAQVIDNGKMLRNFVQILRSGAVGRRSLGSAPKRLVQQWLNGRNDAQLLNDAVGQQPSLADVIKMVHPKPADPRRAALYAYLLGKPCDLALLPQALQDYLTFKTGGFEELPQVPWQMLTALDLSPQQWVTIACRAPWQMTRMNLNSFARHGVFKVGGMRQRIAARLRDPQLVRRARVFPYQLLNAYHHCADGVPGEVREALAAAMEVALQTLPRLPGKVFVLVDVSGSMNAPVTGYRRGASSTVRCVDVAALIASAVLARNPDAELLAFDTRLHNHRLRAADGVLHNAARLARFGGGGTDCSRPLVELNARRTQADLVIFVSDNESWLDTRRRGYYGGPTQVLQEWNKLRSRCPRAKLVCIDLQPYATSQAPERADILNIGGFSDAVFELLAAFAAGELGAGHWVERINNIRLA